MRTSRESVVICRVRCWLRKFVGHHRECAAILACATMAAFFSASVRAQSYRVLHSFSGGSGDGATPYGSLIQSGSILYGMTNIGGRDDVGTIFSFDTTTGVESLIYSFAGNYKSDGANPYGSLTASGPILYGMTEGGSGGGAGTLFSFNTLTNTESVLSRLTGPTGYGAFPYGSLIQSGSTLYGMTAAGNAENSVDRAGTVFSFNAADNTFTVLHSFTGAFGTINPDGAGPRGSLVQSGATLYGMTEGGGANSVGTHGVIFALNTADNSETILHSFPYSNAHDGASPLGSLIQSGPMLYGMTEYSTDIYQGTIFALDTRDNSETILHGFAGGGPEGDGEHPWGSLIQSGSVLYGMTSEGGSTGRGIIFSFDTATGAFNTLHSFDTADGAYPYGDLLLSGNTLFGMTSQGGDYNDGVIFALTLPEPSPLPGLAGAAIIALWRRRREGQ